MFITALYQKNDTFTQRISLAVLGKQVVAARPGDVSSWPLALGFSQLGFDPLRKHALVYAEICSVGPNGVCGGEGFLFAREGMEWRLMSNK